MDPRTHLKIGFYKLRKLVLTRIEFPRQPEIDKVWRKVRAIFGRRCALVDMIIVVQRLKQFSFREQTTSNTRYQAQTFLTRIALLRSGEGRKKVKLRINRYNKMKVG